MIRTSIFLGMLLCNFVLSSAQYIPMNPTEVIPVYLSSSNHNRIGIVGDRIKKAFFRSSNFSVDVEEDSGQIFIQAVRQNCPNATLSLISAAGRIQDLELCFMDSPSEIVLLQPMEPCSMTSLENAIGDEEIPCKTMNNTIAFLVEGITKGAIPEGYTLFDDEDLPFQICNGLTMQRVSRLVNEQQIIFIYKLKNASSRTKCVVECQVNVLDGDWVFLDRYKLKTNESALVLIGCFR